MTDLATLRVVVDASGAIRTVDQFGRTTDRATKQSTALQSAVGLLSRAFVAIGATQATRQLIQTADTMKQLEGRLRLVTDSQQELIQTERQLREVSSATRSSYASTVELYARVARATEQLGISQKDLLRFTELTQMSIRTSGATATEASAALVQLSQGLAAGTLRGEEFNSVIEQTPSLAMAIAAGMNVPIGQLRKLANEGKLTSDAVVAAILRMDETIRGDFATAPLTVSDAWIQLKDAVSQTVAQIDKATGASNLLAKALQGIGNALSTRFAVSDMTIGAAIYRLTGGAFGAGIMGNAAGRLAPVGGDAPRGPTSRDPIVITASAAAATAPAVVAAAEAVDKFTRNLKAMTKAVDDDTALRDKQDRRTKAALSETTVAVEALSESARVFLEQTQIALGRFFSDFLKDGASSLGRFWEDFKQLGREALGNVFAKEVMERYGKGIAEKVGGWVGGALGKVGSLGSGILGPLAAIGGITAGVASLFGRTSKWEEAAEAQNKAARAQLAAAESLRQSVQQRQASFLNDFLNYANTETPQQREIRSLTNQRQALAQDAFDIAKLGGGSLSNQVMNLLKQGIFTDEVAALIRRDANSFNQTTLGRQSLLDFAKALEDLNKAFERNTFAAENAAKAQGVLTLSQFRNSLALSAQSTLSPTAQLAEARRQYDVILALAKAGDASAISSLPETARTLLDASRAVNASGVRYAQDFAKVQADTADLLAQLQQGTIDGRDTILERTEPWLIEANQIADASLVVQQDGFAAVVEELVNVKAELVTMKNALKLSLEELAAAP